MSANLIIALNRKNGELRVENEKLKKARDGHYKSMSYYYDELVAVAEALGREHDGNEVPIGGMAQAVRVLLSRVVELSKEARETQTKLGEALVENLSLLAQIVDLKTAGAEVPSYVAEWVQIKGDA